MNMNPVHPNDRITDAERAKLAALPKLERMQTTLILKRAGEHRAARRAAQEAHAARADLDALEQNAQTKSVLGTAENPALEMTSRLDQLRLRADGLVAAAESEEERTSDRLDRARALVGSASRTPATYTSPEEFQRSVRARRVHTRVNEIRQGTGNTTATPDYVTPVNRQRILADASKVPARRSKPTGRLDESQRDPEELRREAIRRAKRKAQRKAEKAKKRREQRIAATSRIAGGAASQHRR